MSDARFSDVRYPDVDVPAVSDVPETDVISFPVEVPLPEAAFSAVAFVLDLVVFELPLLAELPFPAIAISKKLDARATPEASADAVLPCSVAQVPEADGAVATNCDP